MSSPASSSSPDSHSQSSGSHTPSPCSDSSSPAATSSPTPEEDFLLSAMTAPSPGSDIYAQSPDGSPLALQVVPPFPEAEGSVASQTENPFIFPDNILPLAGPSSRTSAEGFGSQFNVASPGPSFDFTDMNGVTWDDFQQWTNRLQIEHAETLRRMCLQHVGLADYIYSDEEFGGEKYRHYAKLRLIVDFPHIPEIYIEEQLKGWGYYSSAHTFLEAMEDLYKKNESRERPYVPIAGGQSWNLLNVQEESDFIFVREDADFQSWILDENALMLSCVDENGRPIDQGSVSEDRSEVDEVPIDLDRGLDRYERKLKAGLQQVRNSRRILRDCAKEKIALQRQFDEQIEAERQRQRTELAKQEKVHRSLRYAIYKSVYHPN